MAELAQMLIPGRTVVKVNDLMSRRSFAFVDGKLKLFIRAERVASGDPEYAAVRVQIRDASPDSEWTWPLMEGLFILSSGSPALQPCVVPPLGRPRNVHWTVRDIYPDRLFSGERLRNIVSAAQWSEDGLNYDVEMPSAAGSVSHTAYPVWAINPLLMAAIMDGFALWRSNAKFGGAFSLAFRLRQLSLSSVEVAEKTHFHCYLRFTGVTPRSHLADISVSDGNGNLVIELKGYEELTERVPEAYSKLILSPATTYLTGELEGHFIGANQSIPVSSAVVTEVPYKLFERNEELWMKTVSQVVLSPAERTQLAEMTGSTNRRTEWMFGRIAAKDAVRRFLEKYFQARWTAADVQIWADDSGKPHPLGEWNSFLPSKIDLAIAHTAQFVVAIVASNARVGVDVEDAGRDLSEEFTRGVFTADELELVLAASNTPSAILRFWCAKEAVSKALGIGIRYSPREMVINSFNPETGAMKMKLEGQWVEAFKQFKGVQLDISSCVVRGHVLATCFIAESYFS
jgi:phosphopantetheine--protein transferase-like protein